jgi:hypothetical protein
MANPTKSDGKLPIPPRHLDATWMGGRVTASVPPPALQTVPAALAAYMYRSVSQSVTEFLRGPPRVPPTYPLRTPRARSPRLRGGLLSSLGGFVIRIRILMYRDVSCVYPEGYMYPSCILMYLKCILNALLHSKRIHVS